MRKKFAVGGLAPLILPVLSSLFVQLRKTGPYLASKKQRKSTQNITLDDETVYRTRLFHSFKVAGHESSINYNFPFFLRVTKINCINDYRSQ